MARNMGQIQANQKAYTRDLMQFANQGIPIYSQMADILGLSESNVGVRLNRIRKALKHCISHTQ